MAIQNYHSSQNSFTPSLWTTFHPVTTVGLHLIGAMYGNSIEASGERSVIRKPIPLPKDSLCYQLFIVNAISTMKSPASSISSAPPTSKN